MQPELTTIPLNPNETKMTRRWEHYSWWILALAGLTTLILWMRPSAGFQPDWLTIFLGAALVAFLINFPIPVGQTQASLVHTISLPLGLALGPGTAGATLLIGLTVGETIRALLERRGLEQQPSIDTQIKTGAYSFSRQVLSMSGAMAVYLLLGGRFLVESQNLPQAIPTLGLLLCFSGIYLSLHWLSRHALHAGQISRRESLVLILIALVPMPFAILSAASYVFFKAVTLVIYGIMVLTVAPIVRSLTVTERNLQRRIQELSSLGRVSHAIRTSLDLDALLVEIYNQVKSLLNPDYFFIALHNPEEGVTSFPLVMEYGSPRVWAARPLGNDPTDRVIQSGQPLLIAHDAASKIAEMGLDAVATPPQAWLGVPLVTPDRTLGCIVAYTLSPNKTFSQKDIDVLATLGGQAAMAIENALLYEETHDRADALALLNEITASMSSTLDPEKTLELIGHSIIRVGGGQKSAIFLFEKEADHLALAHSTNISPIFTQSWERISLAEQGRLQAFHTGTPLLIPDVTASALPIDISDQMIAEGIRAYADFPLITPSMTIGQLSVYFSEPQQFRPEQVELLGTFAAQAALAVSNARAHAETDEALRERVDQLARLDEIGRELIATLNTEDLFHVILSTALQIPDASIGNLAIHDEKRNGLRVVTHQGYPEASPIYRSDYLIPINQGVPGRSFREVKSLSVPDLLKVSDHIDLNQGDSLSLLCIPILRQDRVLGVLTIEQTFRHAFTSDHENLLAQLASQAAVAIANATLYQQIETHLLEQSLLYQASTQIAATYESEAVALAVADSMAVALSGDGASVLKWEAESRTFSQQANIRNGKPLNNIATTVNLEDVPAYTDCLDGHVPVYWTISTALNEADRTYLVDQRQANSILAVPLVVGKQSIGIIEILFEQEVPFDENAIRTAQTIASQAAIALENTDLFRRIREGHHLLMAVLNSTREGMLMVDNLGNIALANHQLETLTGLQVSNLIGQSLSEEAMNLGEAFGYSAGELNKIIENLINGQPLVGEVTTFEVEHPEERTLQRSDFPVQDVNNQTMGWLVILRDVSEERELSQTRDQLTEMIVHDLRSPLTAILGSLKLLEKGLPLDDVTPVVRQALSISHRSVEQMLGLVNSLLDLAKLESGKLPLKINPIHLDVLCEELVSNFVNEANENGIILNHRSRSDLPEILADEEKIRRVLSNLLDNALKYTPAGGHVDLIVEDETEGVKITVADSGPGVPVDFRERIFKRFAQVPGVAGRRRGTGLGLAFSKMAITAHGGKIWVEENPGGGSAFRIFLPSQS